MWRTIRLENVKNLKKLFNEINRACWISTESNQRENSHENQQKTQVKNIELAQQLFGFEYETARQYVSKRIRFQRLDPDKASKTIDALESFGVPVLDVAEVPAVLNLGPIVVANRYQILKEIGFKRIDMQHLFQFLSLYQSTVVSLHEQSLISSRTNAIKNMLTSFQLNSIPNELNVTQTIKAIRELIMFEYLKRNLQMSDAQINTVLRSYYRKHKSAASILEMVRILKDDLKFTNKRIQSNSYLVYADPDNVKSILSKFETIGGIDSKQLLYKRPKVMMQDLDTISDTLKLLKEFKMSDKSLTVCPDILALQTETVRERLNYLKSDKDFDCLMDNPRILKLVYNFKKAKERLEHLKHTELKCVFIHLLMGENDSFERYIREGIRNRKGNDFIIFLSNQFGVKTDDVRKYISRHPYWKCTPLPVIKANLMYLLDQGYNRPDIFRNLYLLLYPPPKLGDMLDIVKADPTYSNATASQQLSLVLYFMEKGFHFTGDGIWPDFENQDGQLVDISESSVNPSLLKTESKTNSKKLEETILGS